MASAVYSQSIGMGFKSHLGHDIWAHLLAPDGAVHLTFYLVVSQLLWLQTGESQSLS